MTQGVTTTSTLGQVRALMPSRPLTASEARSVLDRQATRLLRLSDVDGPAVPIEEVAIALPRVEVKRHADLPTSGRTQWAGNRWVILVASDEARVRQRFSLGHELGHVVLHPLAQVCLPATDRQTADERLENACEYFAACLLMPRLWMKRAYYDAGIQSVPALARLFNVSWVAMRFRMEQLGLVDAAVADRRAA